MEGECSELRPNGVPRGSLDDVRLGGVPVRAAGVERQQLRWFTYAATLTISGIVLTYTVSEVVGSALLGWVGNAIVVAGALGIPIAMGIAILRYRLYEIDVLINRTVVYIAVTLVLAGIFQAIEGALHYL